MIIIEVNKIYNQDCLVGIKAIPDKSIDLIVMDPPYDMIPSNPNRKDTGLNKCINPIQRELIENNLVNGYDMSVLDELVRVMKNINIYVFCNGRQVPSYIKYFVENLNCKMEVLIWGKTNPLPLYKYQYLSDKEYCLYFRKKGYCNPNNYEDAKTIYISSTNIKDKKLYHHPTIKPLELIRKIIRNSSKENDIVLDCFLGSGTTAVACILENRKYIGFENNENFYHIALNRIEETLKKQESQK